MKIFDINIKYNENNNGNLIINGMGSIVSRVQIKYWDSNIVKYIECISCKSMYKFAFIELYNNIDFYKTVH